MGDSPFIGHAPCDECGSSDARAMHEDGTSYCHSCKTYFHADGKKSGEGTGSSATPTGLLPGEPQPIARRGLSLETCRKYRYLVNDTEGLQLATYFDKSGRPCAQKVRTADKKFRWVGDPKSATLFGAQLWGDGGRRIIVTEGEIDALSVAQVFDLRWAVVSLPNGASGAKKDLVKHLEWLESFDSIVLMFDQDEPGLQAMADCADLFTPGKVKIASLPMKDANEMLMAGKVLELKSATFEAKSYWPEGLVEGSALVAKLIEKPVQGLAYPWGCLDKKLYGQRTGEIVMWCGGTGTGKTQLVKEVAYTLHRQHGQNVGVISLEETEVEAFQGQVSIAMGKRLHLPDVRSTVLEEDITKTGDQIGKGLWFYRSEAGFESSTILPRIRQMVKGLGVRWVVLDHISMMVGANATDGDERKRLDELMYALRKSVQQLGYGLHVICHLRKSTGKPFEEGEPVSLDDLRGSGALKQVANIVISAERNQQAPAPECGKTKLRVLKNRFAGRTGVAGTVTFNEETGRITEFAFGEHIIGGLRVTNPDPDAPKGDF